MKLLLAIGLLLSWSISAQTYSVCFTFSNIVDGAITTTAQMSNNCVGFPAGHVFFGGWATTNTANIAVPLKNYEVFGDGIVRPFNTITIACSNGVTADMRYAGTNYFGTYIDSGSTQACWGGFMRFHVPGYAASASSFNYDLATLTTSNAGYYANLDMQVGGANDSLKFVLETTGGGSNKEITGGGTNILYWVALGLNIGGANKLGVWIVNSDLSLTLLDIKSTATTSTEKFQLLKCFGSNSHPGGQTPNARVEYGPAVLYTGPNCPWPPMPGTNSNNRLITTTTFTGNSITNNPKL